LQSNDSTRTHTPTIILLIITIIPIDKTTGKSRETTAEERISVIEKKVEDRSCREIAEITGILKSQAAEIVKELQQQFNIEDSN
jgi:hypothetical protein